MEFPLVKLTRADGSVFVGDAPKSVYELVEIDENGALEPETLHEWLWDALQYLTDSESELETLPDIVKQYVSVWSVRNYVGNGGLDAPLHSCSLLLPFAVDGYLAIGKPVAAEWVRRMVKARDTIIAIDGAELVNADISDIIYELSDEQWQQIESILNPKSEDVDFDIFDTPIALAEFVRSNYPEFKSCNVPIAGN